jgi:hypothetical protein
MALEFAGIRQELLRDCGPRMETIQSILRDDPKISGAVLIDDADIIIRE